MKSNYLQIMNLIFITLKLLGYINWSWGVVFIPIYIAIFFETLAAWAKNHDERVKKEDQLVKDMFGKS